MSDVRNVRSSYAGPARAWAWASSAGRAGRASQAACGERGGQWRLAAMRCVVRRRPCYWERSISCGRPSTPLPRLSNARPQAARRDVRAHNGRLLVSAAFLISSFFNSLFCRARGCVKLAGRDYRPLQTLEGACRRPPAAKPAGVDAGPRRLGDPPGDRRCRVARAALRSRDPRLAGRRPLRPPRAPAGRCARLPCRKAALARSPSLRQPRDVASSGSPQHVTCSRLHRLPDARRARASAAGVTWQRAGVVRGGDIPNVAAAVYIAAA